MTEPQPKEIIIHAIRVLRSRRVRPSDEKIAWFCRREFLQSQDVTADTLDELVLSGDIFRVLYKGGTSYRVAPHKLAAYCNQPLKSVAKKRKLVPAPVYILRPLLSAILACGEEATETKIAEQLTVVGKRHLADRLSELLQKELRVGFIGKKSVTTPEGKSLAVYYITKKAPLSLTAQFSKAAAAKEKPRSPTPPPEENDDPNKSPKPFEQLHRHLKKLKLEKKQSKENREQAQKIDTLKELAESEETDLYPHTTWQPTNSGFVELDYAETNISGESRLPVSSSPVEEEEKLANLTQSTNHSHTSAKETNDTIDEIIEDEPKLEIDLHETKSEPLDNNNFAKPTSQLSVSLQNGKMFSKRGRPRKPPASFEDMANTLSAIKKEKGTRGRPAFAKHSKGTKLDKKSSNSSSSSSKGHTSAQKITAEENPPASCDICTKAKSADNSYSLLICQMCTAKAHSSCLGYSGELVKKIKQGPWTCMDCKHCSVCDMDHNNGTLIFCDGCDRAFHLTCHNPVIYQYPQGSWICSACAPIPNQECLSLECMSTLPTPSDSPSQSKDEEKNSSSSYDPVLGSSFDPNVPDAIQWSVDDVVKYFTDRGFEKFANVFREQDIDGTALLMLTRSDILTALDLKIGPALKIYKQIRILQTRSLTPAL